MPEYLAPGVYVEEIPSGNKPIQAASTSTAGMVGMAERGPVDVPTLVTSRGAYARLFGGDLDPRVFTGQRDALPYAAAGFFDNLGSRLYVVRIVGVGADESTLRLVARDTRVDAAPVLASTARQGESALLLSDPGALTAGTPLLLAGATGSETAEVGAGAPEARPVLGGGLASAFPAGSTVTVQTATALAGTVVAAVAAGATDLVVTDVTGVTAGATLLLEDPAGSAATAELVTVQAVDGPTTTLTLDAPLRRPHDPGATLSTLADSATAPTTQTDAGPSGAAVFLDLDDPTGVDEGRVVRLADAGATVQELAVVTGVPQLVPLAEPLAADHPPGTTVTPVVDVLAVHARWPGVWGDALRVTATPASLVATTTTALAPAGATALSLVTAVGLYPGSVLVLPGPAGADVTAEVTTVDTRSGVVGVAAALAAEVPAGAAVSSREHTLLVERVEAGRVAESELFERVSFAAAHPRYALTVVGSWDAAADRPSEVGGSALVRLEDLADVTTRRLPLVAAVPRHLSGGDDDVAGVTEQTYVGTPADDPDRRTGIQALENEPTLSIVAVPGQTSLAVQKALVDHCEKMRYRFAVLDVPLGSTVAQARAHRQNFDTTRAALYYPGVSVADRFGAPGERRQVAPSGHVAGVYARTDLTRGVHKAPANEVLRGVLGLRTALTRGEQDILNPIHLNCLRDFRAENRGLRVYGARVATSDPEWRYVNVRRLLLFIEQSLETGLQYAVFEPNDQPLWDTVKQSITGFLLTVWRGGALEGTTQEEAFFVNIGYDVTMTQADIDNGLLVVEVGVAPVKPAEFVVVRISQKTRDAVA